MKFTTSTVSPNATLTRNHVVYARGSTTQTGPGRRQLILRALRPITPARYTLTLVGRHESVTRSAIMIR